MSISLLIVDDDPMIRETAKDVLEDNGFEVRSAGSGAEALVQLKSKPADLAILDFNLPDMTGADLVIQLREADARIHFLVLTGEQTPDLGPAKAFVDEVLTKPVYPAELTRVIKKIFEKQFT